MHTKIDALLEREFDLNETLTVLQSPINIYWCWGVSKKFNYQNKALIMIVNGHLHKGKVIITLAWDDTYSVYLIDSEYNVIKNTKGVYFDMLQYIVDLMIETK